MTATIPKFRKTSRLVEWIKRNEDEELPKDAERLFFTSNEKPHRKILSLCEYAEHTGPLKPELEDLLHELATASLEAFRAGEAMDTHNYQDEANPLFLDALYNYCAYTYRQRKQEIPERFMSLFKGFSYILYRHAWATSERLPKELEDSIRSPKVCLDYSINVLRGRLPENLEENLTKDVETAVRYAFEVIRGFASVRLPEHLHNFVVMKSFEDPDDHAIRGYMEATENDPNKTGNRKDIWETEY